MPPDASPTSAAFLLELLRVEYFATPFRTEEIECPCPQAFMTWREGTHENSELFNNQLGYILVPQVNPKHRRGVGLAHRQHSDKRTCVGWGREAPAPSTTTSPHSCRHRWGFQAEGAKDHTPLSRLMSRLLVLVPSHPSPPSKYGQRGHAVSWTLAPRATYHLQIT